MSNEVTLNVIGSLLNGQVRDTFNTGAIACNQNNAGRFGNVQTIATSDTALVFGGLAQPGFVKLRNLDPTNYIQLGPDYSGMQAGIRLLPQGPEILIYLEPGVTWKAKAHTAACKLDVEAWDA